MYEDGRARRTSLAGNACTARSAAGQLPHLVKTVLEKDRSTSMDGNQLVKTRCTIYTRLIGMLINGKVVHHRAWWL